jgi:hypothetical protein
MPLGRDEACLSSPGPEQHRGQGASGLAAGCQAEVSVWLKVAKARVMAIMAGLEAEEGRRWLALGDRFEQTTRLVRRSSLAD